MTGFLAAIAEWVISKLVSFIASAISKWNSMRVAKEKIEEKNQQVLDESLKAQTKEERENAAKDIIRDI